MPTTQITPVQTSYPQETLPIIAQVKETWTDEWADDRALELVSLCWASAGQDLGEAVCERRYGLLRHPWETGGATVHPPVTLDNWWIRFQQEVDGNRVTLWTGLVAQEARSLYGTGELGATKVPAGNQRYVAYQPAYLLRKISVSESDWQVDDGNNGVEIRRMKWMPDVNMRDHHNTLVGNRTEHIDEEAGSYLYGGTDVWSHKDFVEYLLKRFCDRDDGPTWTLVDGSGVMASIQQTIKLPDSATVDEMLKLLIPPKFGLDYFIETVEGGFQLTVFSLSDTDMTFGGSTLPANPNLVEWSIGQALDLRISEVARSVVHKYSRIRVIGKRMVVCCSLSADQGNPTQLIEGWTTGDLERYLAGTGTPADDPQQHDQARARDEMVDVFQKYVARAGLDPDSMKARPSVTYAGTIAQNTPSSAWQSIVRRTLTWLPLRAGVDYSQGPPDPDPGGEFVPPQAWLLDPATNRYVPVDTLGMGLIVLHRDWGVRVSASPNHKLALNNWPETEPLPADTMVDPKYDYNTLRTTVAIESDQRLQLEHIVEENDDGSVLVIDDDQAELWYLAKDTWIGVNDDGTMTKTTTGYVLRNDVTRLEQLMAGAVARYRLSRGRAIYQLEGWQQMQNLLGQILITVDDGSSPMEMSAPITQLRWTRDVKTTLTAGFAAGG